MNARINKLWRGLSVLLVGCAAFMCCSTAHANFGYRATITIKKALVGASGTAATTITDYAFPFQITATTTTFKTVANGGRVTCATGCDIVFRALDTTTCNGAASCTLSHELVSYAPTTGKMLAWVRIPKVKTISNAAETVIYMYYGDSNITAATTRKTDVWKNYNAVWHLDETGNPVTSLDSSPNVVNGTTSGTPVSIATGQVNRALQFSGTQLVSTATSTMLSGSSAFSVETWTFGNDDSTGQMMVGQTNTDTVTSSSYVFGFLISFLSTTGGSTTNYLTTVVDTGGTTAAQNCVIAGMDYGSTHHYAFTYDGSNVRIYYDGVIQSGCTYAKTGTIVTISKPVTLGGKTSPGTGSLANLGYLDEVRISSVVRDADYFLTVYNHQISGATQSTIRTLGAETAVTAGMFGVEFLDGHAVELPNGQVLLGWETGLEQDNLGFHVLREQNGVVTQVTKDLVGGSLLRAMVGSNGSSPYFWLDSHGWGAGPVRYFVQDVDESGKKVTHGPFLPKAPSTSTSSLLNAWSAQQLGSGLADGVGASASAPTKLLSLSTASASTAPDASFITARSMDFATVSGPPLIKLGVTRAGWQHVTGAQLAELGFPLGVASNQVAILKDGADVLRFMDDGADGTFDAQDALEFWGVGEPGIYANEAVYGVS